MKEHLRPHLDAESIKVYVAAITGGAISWNSVISGAVGVVTFTYIAIKIFKQIRDWSKPDRD